MTSTGRKALRWTWSTLLAVALALAPALRSAADAPAVESRVPHPVLDAPQGDKCVADPAFMRRNHMRLLLHQRDETVHQGTRPRDTSLEGCIACHASRATASVVGSDRNFCQGCHAYAAIKLDCFECHASKPDSAASATTRGKILGAAR